MGRIPLRAESIREDAAHTIRDSSELRGCGRPVGISGQVIGRQDSWKKTYLVTTEINAWRLVTRGPPCTGCTLGRLLQFMADLQSGSELAPNPLEFQTAPSLH